VILVRVLVCCLLALASLAALPVAGPAATAAAAVPAADVPAADVQGDDEQDRYVGTGGLILPGGVDVHTRREVAGCGDCTWRLTTPCIDTGLGNGFDGQPACQSVVRGCPGLRELLRAWTRPVGGSWRQAGLVCLDRRTPVTVAQIDRAVADAFTAELVPVGPTGQPGTGIVTQVPVLFDSGQPAGPERRTVQVLGETVRLTAWPAWTWQFGDGATLRTTDPGGRYPHAVVSHAYRRAGDYRVQVATEWTAEFTVDGLGPFPVTQVVTQAAGFGLRVGEGRAVLTPR
jgi:hypothetical protein